MRFTVLVTKTMRTESTEAETPSHRLMLKSGMIYQVASGVYAYLPLAWRAIRKIEAIIREEIDAVGGQEIRMPVLQPLELWQESGRSQAFGASLFHLKDRRDRSLVLAPTHEEVLSYLAKSYVQSYRDLPVILYQIQTKFRDEPRPRGGLIRVREFDMKDAYSLDSDEETLDKNYQAMAQAYRNIYQRCGLPAIMVEADSGAIGGKDSHEFILPAPTGEDTIIACSDCGYAANMEKARIFKGEKSPELSLPLEDVPTPGIRTIAELAGHLNITEANTLKVVFYSADDELVLVAIRGDLDVNDTKLKNHLGALNLRLATDTEIDKAGLVSGFASPVGLEGIRSVGDDSILLGSNFVVGGNKLDMHMRNANYSRDFAMDTVVDISQAREGQNCIGCGAILESIRGIEVGHIFKLGTVFSETLGVEYLDRDGRRKPIVMGCYGIGIGRLLAAAIEQNHNEKGIMFPTPIAPYQIHLIGLNLNDPQVSKAADELYNFLWSQNIECLYDDRPEESAGVKFNDADLLGLPVRLVLSQRNLAQNAVEIKEVGKTDSTMVALSEISDRLEEMKLA